MSNSDFVIENGLLKKYTGEGGDVVIPKGVTAIGHCAFDGVNDEFKLTIPSNVKEIEYSAFFRCGGLSSLSLSNTLAKKYLGCFKTCPNLQEIVISDIMRFHLSDVENIGDIVISVKDVLFSDKAFDEAKCRALLESIGKDCNLYAIFSARDKITASKLEESGLKQYFKQCFLVNSFENNFGRRIMSREFFKNTIEATVKKQYADDQHKYNDCKMVVISDQDGSYQKGSWYLTIFYDPDKEIRWELPSDGFVVHDFEGILNAVANCNHSYKLDRIKYLVETEFNAYKWLGKYGQYVEKSPEISFENAVFVLNGIMQGSLIYEQITAAVTERGGIVAPEVTDHTDYLIVNPKRAGDIYIKSAIKVLQEGRKIKIILQSDLEKALGLV